MAGGGEDSFVQPLGILLGLTALVALLFSFARQSTIVAFIAVGLALSAAGVPFDGTILGHFSEVGILVLLFMAGLEVELHAFIDEWRTVTIVGVGQIISSTAFNGILAIAVLPAISATWNTTSSIYFGLCMTFSSTILVLGFLKKSKSMGTVYGQLCLGTLVLQDVASVLGLAVLGGLSDGGALGECACVSTLNVTAANMTVAACKSTCADALDGLAGRRLASGSSSDAGVPADGGLSACADAGDFCTFSASVSDGSGVALSILTLFGKLVVAVIIFTGLTKTILPKLFEMFASSLDLLYIGALGYCTGMAAVAIAAGFSGEITAFLVSNLVAL